jgi:hypothetical protein
MGMPGGLAMADRGDDRDGLKLDRLHVPLGSVLADWPVGLVVETVLQGDVIQEAVVRAVRPGELGAAFWKGPRRGEENRWRAAARLDSLGRLLAVAGWPAAAREARRLRDRLLAGADRNQAAPEHGSEAAHEHGSEAAHEHGSEAAHEHGAEVAREFGRFARRVRRSRVLRWMLGGVGVIDGEDLPERLRGDVLRRAYRWVEEAGAAIDRLDGSGPVTSEDADVVLALLPGLLAGAELAEARLIVASLDPDLERVPTGAVAGGG